MNSTPWTNMSFQQLQQPDSRNLAIGALIATTLLATYTFKNRNDDQSLPPLVPYKYPIIGSTIDYYRNPEGFVRDIVTKYGPTFRIYLLGRVQTIVSSREHIKKVLTSDKQLDFIAARDEFFKIESALGIPDKDILYLSKVVADYLNPQLKEYTPRVVRQLETGLRIYLGDFEGQKIIDDPTKMIGYMISRASASIFVGEELCENPELVESFRTLTFDVATQMMHLGPLRLFPRLSNMWLKIYFNYFAPKSSRHADVIRRIVLPIVEKRRREKAELGDKWQRPNDVLQRLIENEDSDPSKSIDPYKIIGGLLVLIFSSIHTTTGNAIAVLYRLANNPQYIPELRQELDSVFEDPESEDYLTPAMVKKLVMLDSFVRETLRLGQEPIRLQHKNITGKALDIGGVIIPAGDHVGVNEILSRLDDDQGPFPENFDPWRFVGKGKTASRIGTDYLAFGMGKHACPGRFLAIQEIKTAISMLVTQYDFQVIGENKKGPIGFTKIR